MKIKFLLLNVSLFTLTTLSANSALAEDSPTHVGHDSLIPIEGGSSTMAKRYLPLLHIGDGCQPYTAVDQHGNWSEGLLDTGGNGSMCSLDTRIQVYVRGTKINNNVHAIMYAYYFPKDNGYLLPKIGHRHDWEYVMVFVENYNDSYNSNEEKIIGAVYSAHGGLSSSDDPNRGGNNNTHIYINYDFHRSVTHSFAEGSEGSVTKHKPVLWTNLSSEAQNSLNIRDFGNAVVPVRDRDNKFNDEVAKAKSELGF